jgi:ComF family protein
MWNVSQRLICPWQRLPGTCQVCHRWPAQPVCERCVARHAPARVRCHTCARPLIGDTTRCGECLTRPGGPVLSACVAAVDYAYPWDDLIARFKFRDEPGLAGPLSDLMRAAPGAAELLRHADLIVPIPVSRDRLAQRGYNQAWELVKAVRQGEDKVCAPAVPDALERKGEGPDQHQLDKKQRALNLKTAFIAHDRHAGRLKGATVLLVDDVSTTGTTLRSAAHALMSAGASSVSAVVLARTPAP